MSVAAEMREQGRGMAGALLVLGISFAYTIETWWLAVETSAIHLIGFVVCGLLLVLPVTRNVGFRSDEAETGPRHSPAWIEFAEAVFQAFFVAYVTLFLIGALSPEDPLSVILRTGLVQIVPLALGAALANEALSGGQDEIPEAPFPRSLSMFALGAVFFAAPIAPTGEVAVLAARASWLRLGAILLITLLVTHLVLYELEFRGQTARLKDLSRRRQAGRTCMLYAIALLVSGGLLVAVGDAGGEPLPTWVSRTVVLAFPGAVGASAARVVLA
jgi:putative integral membrane protein (TIGR02587 family)